MNPYRFANSAGANDPDAETKWGRGWFDDWFNDLDWLASEDLAESIGVVLTDEREAKAVGAFRERLNAMFEIFATQGTPLIARIRGGLVSKKRRETQSR
jgi:hypothetical protein